MDKQTMREGRRERLNAKGERKRVNESERWRDGERERRRKEE